MENVSFRGGLDALLKGGFVTTMIIDRDLSREREREKVGVLRPVNRYGYIRARARGRERGVTASQTLELLQI